MTEIIRRLEQALQIGPTGDQGRVIVIDTAILRDVLAALKKRATTPS
jgi:hypothetical protein